jgi:hypothetical protein
VHAVHGSLHWGLNMWLNPLTDSNCGVVASTFLLWVCHALAVCPKGECLAAQHSVLVPALAQCPCHHQLVVITSQSYGSALVFTLQGRD